MAPVEAGESLTKKRVRPDIAEYYRGKTIFITGGTGFLGKLLVETLARCCKDVKKIYLLSRPKKGKTMEERIEEQFTDPLYEYVKRTNPEVLSKILLLSGDSREPDLGLNNEDINILINEVDIVFHMAATVRFDEELREAVLVNVRSTRDLLNLAHRMTHLIAFIHVSTAYANCVHKTVAEQFYQPPVDGDKLIDMVHSMTDETLERITPKLIGDYPNTYTFTKCVAEDLVRKYTFNLPIAMVRPAIVTSVYRGHSPGWNDNLYGPNGVGCGLATGVIHALRSRYDLVASFIPADYVINTLIAVSWEIGTSDEQMTLAENACSRNDKKIKEKGTSADEAKIVKIYNSATSDNPLTWGLLCRLLLKYNEEQPSNLIIWKPFYYFIENELAFNIYILFVHWIPAYIVDTILKLARQEPRLVKIYKKINKFQTTLAYFTMNEWNFPAENTKQLYDKLSDADKVTFDFDVRQIDWMEYNRRLFMGVRKYVLKEKMTPAHKRLFLAKVAHYTLCALLLFGLYKLLEPLLSSLIV